MQNRKENYFAVDFSDYGLTNFDRLKIFSRNLKRFYVGTVDYEKEITTILHCPVIDAPHNVFNISYSTN